MDASTLARACANAMWAEDTASRSLGVQLISVEPGHAVLAMMVTEAMVNGYNICHGGFIFTLADLAFAYASNTYNQRTVAQHCDMTFLNPAQFGDRLVANAVERHRADRSGMYDVTVSRDEGFIIAEFRGIGRVVGGEIVPGAHHTGTFGAKA